MIIKYLRDYLEYGHPSDQYADLLRQQIDKYEDLQQSVLLSREEIEERGVLSDPIALFANQGFDFDLSQFPFLIPHLVYH